MKNNDALTRFSTREIAQRLGTTEAAARQLLTAARVPYTRVGQAYLWDAKAVEQLLSHLAKLSKDGGNV